MADLSKIKLNGITYTLKDTQARAEINNIPAWAKATNKPTYTASEVGAITSNETSQMIATAVGDITSFSTEVVQSLPASGIAGRFYFLANGTSGTANIYDEYIYVNNGWEKLGSLNTGSVDLSGYLLKTDIAAWAKAANKPSYTASEVGALSSSTTYVSSVNGQSGAVNITLPVDVSEFNNDAGYLTLATLPKYDGTVV